MSNKIYDQGMNGKNLEKLNTVSSSRQTQEHIFWAGRRDGRERIRKQTMMDYSVKQ